MVTSKGVCGYTGVAFINTGEEIRRLRQTSEKEDASSERVGTEIMISALTGID